MAVGDIIKVVCEVESAPRYFKNDWGIVDVSINETIEGEPVTNKYNCVTIVGVMPCPKIGELYYLTAKETHDPVYGKQYETVFMGSVMEFDTNDNKEQKKFFSTIFTDGQVKEIFKALPNPWQTFLDGDMAALTTIKGCGFNTAPQWLKRFNEHMPTGKIYMELADYQLTQGTIKKLIAHYRSPDLVIEKVRENPYILCEVSGIGWKTADAIAMKGGVEPYSTIRVKAFLLNYLEGRGYNGFSYVEPSELMSAIVEVIGDEVSDLTLSTSMHELYNEGKLWWNDEKSKVGLEKYRRLEERIGEELIRILKAENQFNFEGWEEVVKRKEYLQGWEYTEQQIKGIELVLKNQISVITGFPGTGKTSIVDGMLSVFKNYSFAQTALSGRAASRMAEVTGEEGFTIHRLLGFPCLDEYGKQQFAFHDERPLPYDIVIVDEISMVDGYLFYYLIRAIKDGAKLVLLGDVGQLESIGCLNIASDLIESPIIPTVQLTQIHRQAKDSAIITESKKVREGTQIIEKDWVGIETRGELQDLTIECYSDSSNTFYKVMQQFSAELEKTKDIMELQVVVPVKSGSASTWTLNNTIQELYNPAESGKEEMTVFYGKDRVGVLRVGDKVINTKNNYKTVAYINNHGISVDEENPHGKTTPIFNGNMGMITHINKDEGYIVVDFLEIGEIVVTKDLFKGIELGYACTVHKVQGSQWDTVIFGFDFASYILLTKELVNTAITRAKKHCIVVAQNSALRYAVAQNGVQSKQTHLVEILNELNNPKFVF